MIVVADDITGAAEMAGIAFAQGLPVRLVCGSSVCCDTVAAQITVVATDTRSMSEAEAVAETRRITSAFIHHTSAIFKKTDSALRGHVVAELSALMEVTGYKRAVYLPANPSKKRVIRNGIYYINNVPIHETAFSYDPEFPAKTSVLKERFPDAEAKGIIMPDAESEEDIRRIIAEYDDGHTIFAGAADLFTALDHGDGSLDPSSSSDCDQENRPHDPNTLILCGSTQSKPLDLGIPIAPMPREVYDGQEDANYWFTHLPSSFIHHPSSVILTIPFTHHTGKEIAVHLRTVMAEMAKRLITTYYLPLYMEGDGGRLSLIIEGGATAWATLQTLGWTDFTITAQFAPGVVQMKSVTTGTLVTLKPGSYPWGNLFSAG